MAIETGCTVGAGAGGWVVAPLTVTATVADDPAPPSLSVTRREAPHAPAVA